MSERIDLGRTIKSTYQQMAGSQTLHYLTEMQGVTLQRAVPITTEPVVLGRDPSQPFQLPDADVSRSHCQVRLAGDRVLVRDLGSRNGTFIDGARVTEERVLPVSSQLQIGKHTLRHELLSEADVARHEQFAKDLARARQYVEALIPAPLERGPVHARWCFVPASVLGGDALGYHELEGGRLALYVLDVCGHGVGSAMHSASVLNALRDRTLPGADSGEPALVLERLNEAFSMEHHGGMFFSIFYAVLDPRLKRLQYASAGHPPAILLGADGLLRCRLGTKNPPIGTQAHRKFEQAEAEIAPGERLYVFSDGVYEIRDREGRERGLEDFERELQRAGADRPVEEPRRLYDAARSAAGTDLLDDDFTLLIVELGSNSSS